MLRRRVLLVAILVGVFVSVLGAPASASAAQDPGCLALQAQGYRIGCPDIARAAPLSYRGWATLNLNYCAPGRACAKIYHSATEAWSWSGGAWRSARLYDRQQVYVWPYTGEWRWAWTAGTGWVAVSGERFEI